MLLLCCQCILQQAFAQLEYVYRVDLNKVEKDALTINVDISGNKQSSIVFAFAKIIPGTYRISDYGQFISKLKAFDQKGKALPVKKLDKNRWQISQAASLARISYIAEDIFDSELEHTVYPMAATGIEAGKLFIFNMPGFFGHIEGQTRRPSRIIFDKPAALYASTSLVPVAHSESRDEFRVATIDELYDSPIMYSVPDTTTVQVGNCQVLVSVHAAEGKLKSAQIAGWMSELLHAAKEYLGGRLPADRYAFLYYFKPKGVKHSFNEGYLGALEHPSSSFYYLPEMEAADLKDWVTDMSSHEFFHIITPLTIASRQVKEFNFGKPELSAHLWLYEGVTEYTAHHVQVQYGLKSQQDFLKELSKKISVSRSGFNDTLPFTELSRESAGKHSKQYGNVYQKGAMIAACLDIYLLHLSQGRYGLRQLTHDLALRYGKERAFDDEELFQVIGQITWPEITRFLQKYVAGKTPIPYGEYFAMAGIRYIPELSEKIYSTGNIGLNIDSAGVYIAYTAEMNEFGKKMGYQEGDRLYAMNGITIDGENISQVMGRIRNSMKEGEMLDAKVGRKNDAGKWDTLMLRSVIEKVQVTVRNKLEQVVPISPQQQLVQRAWLKPAMAPASIPPDIASPGQFAEIDSLLKTFYGVISGAAGPRNWDLFQHCFMPDAKMGSMRKLPDGQMVLEDISTADYRRRCAPLFFQKGFYEEELQRKVNQFGHIAVIASAYQFRFSPGGQVVQRGINYFTVVKSGGRWWIQNLLWQGEDENNKLRSDQGAQ